MHELYQPIYDVCSMEDRHCRQPLTLYEFLKLLKEEEDYFAEEQNNTWLMISRLRKIFYDEKSWNRQLIRGAAHVRCRYRSRLVYDKSEENNGKRLPYYKKNIPRPKIRKIVYRADDHQYSKRANTPPWIYIYNHQEVVLPDGYCCDIGHILCGLDAINHPQVVTPSLFLYKHFKNKIPYVENNCDIVTWLGDIASSTADFLVEFRKTNKPPSPAKEQQLIMKDAPGSDMLGNMDAYVIGRNFPICSRNGMRVTDILKDYFQGSLYKKRCTLFCEYVGLKNWDGNCFSNEEEWIERYYRQLLSNTCFQLANIIQETIIKYYVAITLWASPKPFEEIIKLRTLLRIFLEALKKEIKKEMLPL